MADLYSTYDKRIKFTINNAKVDATLTWFPVTVLLTTDAGEEVFVELNEDADFDKCAFTKADESTQLYADCELYDVSEELAVYHVSLDGWEISSSGDTDFYMYYDDDASSNDTYISKTATTGSIQPPAHTADYVKSTTEFFQYYPYYATDPARSLVGDRLGLEWLSVGTAITNQRFHIDLGSAKIINKIYYENSHDSGGDTDKGVQNFTFQGSNTGAGTFDDLVYANDEGWTTLTTSQSTFDEHTGSDAADPKYITVTNNTAYRYYAFKFADNHGDGTLMALRNVALQRTAAATSVYDGNFKAVYHMNDDTTSTILDSTSNSNDGTKLGANEPVEATGQVGMGQDFDGTNDYINLGTSSTLQPESGSFTVEAVAKTSDVTAYRAILECREGGSGEGWKIFYGITTGEIRWSCEDHDGNGAAANADTDCSDGEYHHVVGIRDVSEDELTVFLDGAEDVTPVTDTTVSTVNSGIDLLMGCNYDSSGFWYNDVIDEVRISKTRRTNAWINATYNSLWDTLLTYGDEETEEAVEAVDNAIFFSCNF